VSESTTELPFPSLRLVPRSDVKESAKDFKTDQEVRWCPGCGDYAILAGVQAFMPELGVAHENIVFISGIGCSSRFPYYMNTFGMHSIHGRAPAIASGLAITRPDLSVWVVTGDGDALSIGGNHLIHALRRNVNLKILLFNNRIYGLTKGQYSPTSEMGKVTKSTPMGSLDQPFNPVSLAIGAEASFVARTIDSDRKHLIETLRAAAAHDGTALVEIYQNCNIFNDGAWDPLKDSEHRDGKILRLVHGEKILLADGTQGVVRRRRPARAGRRRRGRARRRARPRRDRQRPVDGVRALPPVRPGDARAHAHRRVPRRTAGHLRPAVPRPDVGGAAEQPRRPRGAAVRQRHLGHRVATSDRPVRPWERRRGAVARPGRPAT